MHHFLVLTKRDLSLMKLLQIIDVVHFRSVALSFIQLTFIIS